MTEDEMIEAADAKGLTLEQYKTEYKKLMKSLEPVVIPETTDADFELLADFEEFKKTLKKVTITAQAVWLVNEKKMTIKQAADYLDRRYQQCYQAVKGPSGKRARMAKVSRNAS